MAERLTRNNKVNFYFHDEASNMVYYKLQKLEDIMEKYHCNDIEELEKKLADSDTWQKACELACREAPLHCPNPPEYYNAQDEYGSDEPYYIQESACEFSDDAERCLECQINYFCQQAKKEGENETT